MYPKGGKCPGAPAVFAIALPGGQGEPQAWASGLTAAGPAGEGSPQEPEGADWGCYGTSGVTAGLAGEEGLSNSGCGAGGFSPQNHRED